jgi:hypothetical protein
VERHTWISETTKPAMLSPILLSTSPSLTKRYRRARRIETAAKDAPKSVNRELDNARPESLHNHASSAESVG